MMMMILALLEMRDLGAVNKIIIQERFLQDDDDNYIRDERSWNRQQDYHPRQIFLQDDSDQYSRGHRDAKLLRVQNPL